ncbi:MAG: hypothetical protein ACYCZA_14455 [Thiobacillus sp.]
MSKVLLALTSAALLALSGCADMQYSQGPDKAEAQAALAQAQADVKMAKSRNALWTTAADALKNAETAATKGDSATVLKNAKLASDYVKKGLAQLNYPLIQVGK